jgi:hypothetical protein
VESLRIIANLLILAGISLLTSKTATLYPYLACLRLCETINALHHPHSTPSGMGVYFCHFESRTEIPRTIVVTVLSQKGDYGLTAGSVTEKQIRDSGQRRNHDSKTQYLVADNGRAGVGRQYRLSGAAAIAVDASCA